MNNDYPTVHDKREMNKMGLETFWMDVNNVLDPAIDDLMDQLKSQAKEREDHAHSLEDLKENNPEHYKELQEQADRSDVNLEHSQVEAWMDVIYYEEQLTALAEMKIIHAFKFMEINVKRLIKASFDIKSAKMFFRWENLMVFLRDHNIDITKFKSYKDVDELRRLNNKLKHSDEEFNDLQAVSEFKNVRKLYYDNLGKFYARIEKSPYLFLQELTHAIYIELYEFDENKLNQIASELANRMDKSDAMSLAEKIKNIYANS